MDRDGVKVIKDIIHKHETAKREFLKANELLMEERIKHVFLNLAETQEEVSEILQNYLIKEGFTVHDQFSLSDLFKTLIFDLSVSLSDNHYKAALQHGIDILKLLIKKYDRAVELDYEASIMNFLIENHMRLKAEKEELELLKEQY